MVDKVLLFGVDGLIPELVYKFVQEGSLPNIAKMLREGSSTVLLPFISTWGDVNFVSMLSGQAPGSSWFGQQRPVSNQGSLMNIMEHEGYKSALVHFPCSLSVEGTNHFVYAPFGDKATAIELIPGMIYSTCLEKWSQHNTMENLGWPPQHSMAHHKKANRNRIDKIKNRYEFEMQSVNKCSISVRLEPNDDGSLKFQLPENECFNLACGEWSPWTSVQLGKQKGTVRFKLLEYDVKNNVIDILQSQVNVVQGLSNDPKLEQMIHRHCGPFISKWTVTASPDEPYFSTSFEEAQYQATWLANVAIKLLNEGDCHLFATVYRLVDETHHTCLGQCDPKSPFYDPKRAPEYERVMRQSYQLLDQTIGKILREKNKDTTLLVVSDHGNVPNSYFCDIYRRLEECGLVKLDSIGLPILEHSKAYLKDERGGLEIFVNLQEREEQGIVTLQEYDDVQNQIYKALSTWFHETSVGLQNVVGLIFKKQDAGMIGYWGERTGDVIFAYNQGFVWGSNDRDVVAKVSVPGANHGPQIPTATTGYSSNYGFALWHGPKIRVGYKRDHHVHGAYSMNDVGTTLAYLLGLKNKESLDGRCMQDLYRRWQ